VAGPSVAGQSIKANHVIAGTVLIAVLQSLQLVIGTYSGWNSTCFFAEEDKNPSRNIPRSLYSGAIIVILIYVLLNMAFLHVLPVSALANSSLVASDVANVLFGNTGAVLITIVAVFSIVSILNAYMMIPARILFGMSRDRFFVSQGTYVNRKGTPTFSLIFSALMNLVLILIGSFNTLFALSAFMSVIVFLFVYAALVKLRVSRPDLPRPAKAWGHPATSFILIIISVGLLVGFAFGDPKNLMVMLAVTLLSYPIYHILVKRK
jgi:basic amino acid/polyamine antiporter, APA family